eukprot:scaffold29944_cov64-Phaeocystis_antarctica.AAC.2
MRLRGSPSQPGASAQRLTAAAASAASAQCRCQAIHAARSGGGDTGSLSPNDKTRAACASRRAPWQRRAHAAPRRRRSSVRRAAASPSRCRAHALRRRKGNAHRSCAWVCRVQR